MRAELEPTTILPSEGPEVQCLHWIPLAVRYKLDVLGLRLKLVQWQDLPIDQRRMLVDLPIGDSAAECALSCLFQQAGALPDGGVRTRQPGFEQYLASLKASGRRCL